MPPVKMKWYGSYVRRKLYRHVNENLDGAAISTTQFIKDSFGDSGVKGTRSGATKAQRGANRSQPWGPPNVDTSHLKDNVGWDKGGVTGAGFSFVKKMVRRVGTSLKNMGGGASVGYGFWLEFGTRYMLPRPFIRPGIWKSRSTIKRWLSRPMRG